MLASPLHRANVDLKISGTIVQTATLPTHLGASYQLSCYKAISLVMYGVC